MAELAIAHYGTGAPLVLLHGLGSSARSWDPVVPALAASFEVLAVDLPGFGDSEPLPEQVAPNPAALAAAVGARLDELGIHTPHVAGNSLGGWVALEFAHIRPVASLTLLSPAGLWSGNVPLYNRASLRATRWLAQHAAGGLSRLVGRRLGRALVFSQTQGRPSRMSAEAARAAIVGMATCPGFDATLAATARGYRAGPAVDAPVTVAFGSRDRLLRRRSRRLEELPPHTRVATLPGCGHLPMSDDPVAVTALITATAARAGLDRGLHSV